MNRSKQGWTFSSLSSLHLESASRSPSGEMDIPKVEKLSVGANPPAGTTTLNRSPVAAGEWPPKFPVVLVVEGCEAH